MYADLNNDPTQVITGNDNVVIKKVLGTIRGGRTLSVSAYAAANTAETVLKAGHVIIRETATGNFKPMPISGAAYDALPSGHTYAGILINTILLAKPFAGIMIRGDMNPNAAPFTMTSIQAALKAAQPLITYLAD